jgi:hypothetical protein
MFSVERTLVRLLHLENGLKSNAVRLINLFFSAVGTKYL